MDLVLEQVQQQAIAALHLLAVAPIDGDWAGEPARVQDDSETLQQRMTDALATLKKSSSSKGNNCLG